MPRPKVGMNGMISYRLPNGTVRQRKIWVMKIEQGHQLSGIAAQSAVTKHFYPRSYAPGQLTVSGRCRTEIEYQRLARFIRNHHRSIINSQYTNFARTSLNAPGYNLLLKLSIPDEGILIRGWVPNFSITKKGYFNPAPEYQMPFHVVFDPHSTNIVISHQIKKWFTPSAADVFSSPGTAEGPEPFIPPDANLQER